jgi:hypothetical protein
VPGSPQYYLTVAATSVVGAGNYCRLSQPLEDVRIYSGRPVAVSFWARASVAGTPVTVAFEQYFGDGVSAAVPGIGRTKLALSTSWQRYQVVADINSVSGKTIRPSNVTYLDLQMWLDAGADFNGITDTLGQGPRTIHVTNITLVTGRAAMEAEGKSDWTEFDLLQRYYHGGGDAEGIATPHGNGLWCAQTVPPSTVQYFPSVRFRTRMRVAPTVALFHPVTRASQAYNVTRDAACTGTVIELIGNGGFAAAATTPAASAAGDLIGFHWTADARF